MTFEVGQTVERRGAGRVQRRTTGTVVSVARKYCTVLFVTQYGESTAQFDKETGLERGDMNYPQHLCRIKTPEEWAKIDREAALRKALRDVGIEFNSSKRVTDEQVEDIAKVMGIEL